jgi:alcohol dehydrogenase
MAGSVKAMDLAYRVTRRGGTTVSAGLSHPDHDFALKHVGLVAEERTIKGSYIGSCVPARDLPRFVALYRQGRLPVDRLMSERVGFEELNAAFDRLAAGTRCVSCCCRERPRAPGRRTRRRGRCSFPARAALQGARATDAP